MQQRFISKKVHMNNPSVIPAFDFREMVKPKTERSLPHQKSCHVLRQAHGDVLGKSSGKADCSMNLANAILRRLIISINGVSSPDV
jgi:hypothetical protein